MWPYPRIVAHRCGGKLAPENTLAAARCGLAHGFHAVEFDAMMARDGVPVVMHDPVFGRVIRGSGKVAAHTAAELAQMDVGSWFGPQFAGEPVPLLSQMLDFCREHAIWMDVEIKPAPGYEVQTGEAVARMVSRHCQAGPGAAATANATAAGAPVPPPLLTSFSFDALMAAKVTAPALARAFLMDVIAPDWRQQLDRLGARILQTNHKNLTPALARTVKQAGISLFCYTVNSPERAREILSWGVDGFCTDRIDLIGPDFQ